MSISRQEINPHSLPLDTEQQKNFEKLFIALNCVREAWGQPMIVTSGVRSLEQQIAIYKPRGIKPPLHSAHLKAAAADIWDRDRTLWQWCLTNIKLLEEFGLWLEDKNSTPTWVHFQIYPPASGNRIFVP